jgi:LAO/AO transport system kinase
VLGDRVRMQAHAADPGVFIRSMATRGHLGGLSRATGDAVVILDAAGYEVVVVETVGVGQDEVDVVGTADLSIVVLAPGAGDEVQALKAGVMEIADVFVVNKADREGADRAAAAVQAMLSLEDDRGKDGGLSGSATRDGGGPPETARGRWRPPVVRTIATTGSGIDDLIAAVERFRSETMPSVGTRRRRRSESRLRQALAAQCMARLERAVTPGEWEALVDAIDERRIDPGEAAGQVLGRVIGSAQERGGGGGR